MPRYILIDSTTGYIFGDTANLPSHSLEDEVRNGGNHSDETMLAAARWLDEAEIGEYGRHYEIVSRIDGETGYMVYRADINGSEAVPVITDGQDQEMIEAVERDCCLVGYVRCHRSDD